MQTCKTCGAEKPLDAFYFKNKRTRRLSGICKECDKERIRMKHLVTKFGITYIDFCEMEEAQNHVCAICGEFETHRRGQRLCVDHNHETGIVRGLLCHHCNTGLGLLGDSTQTLQNAINYLEKHQ